MTKAEMIKEFKEQAQITATQAEIYLDRFGDILAAALIRGEEAPLPGIGKLRVKTMAARKGRNPQTGESIDIPARKRLAVSEAKAFKDALQ